MIDHFLDLDLTWLSKTPHEHLQLPIMAPLGGLRIQQFSNSVPRFPGRQSASLWRLAFITLDLKYLSRHSGMHIALELLVQATIDSA